MRYTIRAGRGFTLMELLVVLLIIGILSTVAIRTIDATRDRALFDKTAEEMKLLAQAMTGNPNLVMDGRRVDFGFFGDMGRLPSELKELVEDVGSVEGWDGPYVRLEFTGDSLGYLYDAWGNPYTYTPGTAELSSMGNGKYPMTTKIVDDTMHLVANTIAGSIQDTDGNPPGEEIAGGLRIELRTQRGTVVAAVDPGGHYEFEDKVPAGIHQMVASSDQLQDSVVRWVTVIPRSTSVVDFRFSRPFRNLLQLINRPRIELGISPDTNGFMFDIINRHFLALEIDSVEVLWISPGGDTAFFRDLWRNGVQFYGYPAPYGMGDRAPMVIDPSGAGLTIAGDRAETVTLAFLDFHVDTTESSNPFKVYDKTFIFRFSDGSEITVMPSLP